VVLDEPPSSASRSISLFDLEAGSVRTLTEAPAGYHAWAPAISAGRVAWIDWHYRGADNTGVLDWRIELQDVASGGAARTLDSGVQVRETAGNASWPALDLDGDRVVYAIEDPARAPDGWQIIVRTVSGDVIKTIHTPRPVYDLAASGGAIAWTEGTEAPASGAMTATHLYVAQGSATTGTEMAADAYDLALQDGRLAWTQDDPGGRGAPVGTRIWSADLATMAPVVVSPLPRQGTEQLQEWPATGDGLVTWGSVRLAVADPTVDGERLCLWSPAIGRALELPTPGAVLAGVGGGWLVWVDYTADPQTLSGVPEQALGLP
jgi:hypothetical protein